MPYIETSISSLWRRVAERIRPWAGALYKHDRARPERTQPMGLRAVTRICALVLAGALAGLALARAEPRDFIHADGTHLVDGRGNQFDIKGINLGNWLVPEGYMFKFKHALSPMEIAALFDDLLGREAAADFWKKFRDVYIAKDDIDFIKKVGFNTVRVPLDWRLFAGPGDDVEGGQQIATGNDEHLEGEGWALLDRLVQWSHAAGVRVIVDLHAAPGGQTGVNHDNGPGFPMTFYVPRYRRMTIALWQKIAAHYRDETAILGYDLLNEPISPYSDVAYLNPRLEPLYRDIVTAIRRVDPNHAVLLGGAQWNTNFAVFDKPFDDNAIYTYHKFWVNPSRDGLQEYLNFSNRWHVPILIGETGEFNNGWNDKFRRLNESFGFGWIFWPYKNLDSDLSVVTIPGPASWDLIASAGSGGALPPRPQAQAVLDAYLEAAKFKNVRPNDAYIHSLGFEVP
jgi:endoglucanase